ncbi:MAG: PEP/pyruvate-binding domain-containing protein [Gemmataceae bacterium]
MANPTPGNAPAPTLEAALAEVPSGTDARRHLFVLDDGSQLAASVDATADGIRVSLVSNAAGPLALHWGLAPRFPSEWRLPPDDVRPAGSAQVTEQAVRSPFVERNGLQWLAWEWRPTPGTPPPCGLRFVLHRQDNAWLRSGGGDLFLPLQVSAPDPRLPSERLRDLAGRIVGAEIGASSWTLMHRFHLCHDLLHDAAEDEEALTLLFAWLRFSAARHLDWQRRYNTKPRELAHAQDRLTRRLAGVWAKGAAAVGQGVDAPLWARLMLTTLGPGGDGQRVRDEILHIMHRNHIKETQGHFMEEWHQKLHNNTTPDDVVICAAYLAFLRSDGNRDVFYQTLQDGGVTRERLRSFERPIVTDPTFNADQKAKLIEEFENFLRILRSVHSGRDLDSAVRTASRHLSPEVTKKLDALRTAKEDDPAAVVAVRADMARCIVAAKDDTARRDLLFLDLALEDRVRAAIERLPLSRLDLGRLTALVSDALRNLALSVRSTELDLCATHWAALRAGPAAGRDWALQAKSVADRAGRWVQEFTGVVHQRLQPKAEALGEGFEVDAEAVALFTEEVIRGGPVFTVSLLLRHLDALLRKEAGLGGWQVVSPASAVGRVRVTRRLLDVQGERFAEATVLIADAVIGSEEIPENVTAVLTADAPDLVSHVAVRARNAHVLLATCYDRDAYERLKEKKDQVLTLSVTPGGDLEVREGGETRTADRPGTVERTPAEARPVSRPAAEWVLTAEQFTSEVVGGKSCNLNGLRGRLGDWIHLPTSMALPFGVMERVLDDPANQERRREVETLVATAEANPTAVLEQLRTRLLNLTAPAELRSAVQETWQKVGLSPVPWEQAWHAICRVWASKWNDRAYLSRRARGAAHDRLRMAVLIQQLVEADYAFVIHTANPLTGNRAEIFAEVVLGLGETLVGNYPGRALGFVCRKDDLSVQVVSYPSKSVGLYGTGVIFRSDSDGEDLEGFAGAGLYDSFPAMDPEHRVIDYLNNPLIRDGAFRDQLLRSIARVGLEVEAAQGSPQDVEGAVAGGRFYVVQTRPQVGLTG